MKNKAFTLIELLVVVVIIAILAGLLFPVLAKARERARVVHCLNNLKQIGIGVSLYLEDNDGWYPDAWALWRVVQGNRPILRQKLEPYIKVRSVYRCPSDTGEVFRIAMETYPYPTPPFYSDHFGMSSYAYLGIGIGESNGQVGGYPTSRVKNASQAVVVVEPRPWHGGYDPFARHATQSAGLVGVLYCDGHVARRTWSQWYDDARRGVGLVP